MKILPNEVESVENIGTLDGAPVHMIRCAGGFYVSMGRPKGKKEDEALAAGSHGAIVKYNVQKNFPDFQPTLAKSEHDQENVIGFSELLPKDMRDRGYDMYMLEKHEQLQYVLAKHGTIVNSYNAQIKLESIQISKPNKPLKRDFHPFADAVTEAVAKKALFEGKEFVEHSGRKYSAERIAKRK